MIFDEVDKIMNKKSVNIHDKAAFLANVPDVTISMNCDTTRKAIEENYTKDDINELFDYWFSFYRNLHKKDDYLWK